MRRPMAMVDTYDPVVVTIGERRGATSLPDDPTGRRNMRLLIQLRWIALIGQAATIVFVGWVMGVALPMREMGLAVCGLLVFNLFSLIRWRNDRRVSANALLVAFLVDVMVLTAQLYYSGGARNPFVYLYLVQVTLGGVLLPVRQGWTLLAFVVACGALLAWFYQPLPLSLFDHGGTPEIPYLAGLLICLLINAALIVFFLTRIGRNRRDRDARLAALRQRAAEEEHIVRMGLLASGAAHELSTPLSTLSVILGDWRHLPAFRSDPDRAQEIEDMQTQIDRCKTIVQGILQSAGELRGVAPEPTTIAAFLDGLAAAWRTTRPEAVLICDNQVTPDRPILADLALRQMIENVLDNAREASTTVIGLVARIVRRGGSGTAQDPGEERLEITVTDRGPGFDPAVLAEIGKPYRSTKSRPGAGLGLFLAVNVARSLGGTIEVGSRRGGGAIVRMVLPLAAIAIDSGDFDADRPDDPEPSHRRGPDDDTLRASSADHRG